MGLAIENIFEIIRVCVSCVILFGKIKEIQYFFFSALLMG